MSGRTIIKTKTAGWYEDPATGKKTRKQDGDQILTKQEWEAANSEIKTTEKKDYGVLSTGKVAHGPTCTIKCQHKEKGKLCGTERVIQVQDKFQVKFCIDHQKEERNRLRRERRKAKAAEAKK